MCARTASTAAVSAQVWTSTSGRLVIASTPAAQVDGRRTQVGGDEALHPVDLDPYEIGAGHNVGRRHAHLCGWPSGRFERIGGGEPIAQRIAILRRMELVEQQLHALVGAEIHIQS